MNIYVGNLSLNTSETDLQKAFEAYGPVESVKIIKDFATGYSKGFGFVEMSSSEDANEAIKNLNSSTLDGNALTVNEARPKTERSGGGGNYGGGGGGGFRKGGGGGNRGGGGGYGGGGNRGGGGSYGKRW